MIKELFSSKNLKRLGLTLLYSSSNLTAADYARISESIKMIDNEANKVNQSEMKIEKASYAV